MTVPPVAPFPEAFHLHKACAVVWCYAGDPARADEVFAPIRQMEPAFDGIGAAPFPALQSTFDGLYPKGLQWYWRGDFFRAVSDGAVEAHARFIEELPTMHSTMHLYPIDGAVHRVGQTDTAWAYRDVNFSQVIAGVDPDPANAAMLKRWAVDYWDATHPHSAGGAYVNFMMDEGRDRIRRPTARTTSGSASQGAIRSQQRVRINQNIERRDRTGPDTAALPTPSGHERAAMVVTQMSPSSLRPHLIAARVAAPATHSSVPTAVPRADRGDRGVRRPSRTAGCSPAGAARERARPTTADHDEQLDDADARRTAADRG